jgi:hypothetical protein
MRWKEKFVENIFRQERAKDFWINGMEFVEKNFSQEFLDETG